MKIIKSITVILVSTILLPGCTFGQPPAVNNMTGDYSIYFTLRKKENENANIVYYDGSKLNDFKVKSGSSSRGENQAAISADGKSIAFNTYQFGGWKTAFSKVDGTNIKQIDKSRNYAFTPRFSNDGKWIVYTAHSDGRFGTRDIYKIKTNGDGKARLTKNSRSNYTPSFSPDGSKIAFVSSRDGKNYEIFVMKSDGSKQTNLTKHPSHEACPSWSPDGKQIAFLSVRGDFLNLFVMDADGSDLRNVTNNQLNKTNQFVQTVSSVDEMSYMYGTSWSPDGKSIVFVQNKNGKQKLYTINVDGSALSEVVETSGEQCNPFWAE